MTFSNADARRDKATGYTGNSAKSAPLPKMAQPMSCIRPEWLEAHDARRHQTQPTRGLVMRPLNQSIALAELMMVRATEQHNVVDERGSARKLQFFSSLNRMPNRCGLWQIGSSSNFQLKKCLALAPSVVLPWRAYSCPSLVHVSTCIPRHVVDNMPEGTLRNCLHQWQHKQLSESGSRQPEPEKNI